MKSQILGLRVCKRHFRADNCSPGDALGDTARGAC